MAMMKSRKTATAPSDMAMGSFLDGPVEVARYRGLPQAASNYPAPPFSDEP